MPRFGAGYGPAGGRNYGFGRSLAYAGFNAVRDRFGHGHFASVQAHAERWRTFATWAKRRNIRDARDIAGGTIKAYGAYVRERIEREEMTVSTAQNIVSSINVILEWMRGDKRLWHSPSALVGPRSTVRTVPPRWIDRDQLARLVGSLSSHSAYGQHLAAMVGLSRELGLRWRETALIDARKALQQAMREGRIRLVTGTKGRVPREIPVRTERQIEALTRAANIPGIGKSLVPTHLRFASFAESVSRLWQASGGERFHDLRAAYACERYQELTGCPPPVLNGGRLAADPDEDWKARFLISEELGHHRADVLSHYIGGRAG